MESRRSRKRVASTVTRAKRAKKGSLALKRAVVSNSKAIKSIKEEGGREITEGITEGEAENGAHHAHTPTEQPVLDVAYHISIFCWRFSS